MTGKRKAEGRASFSCKTRSRCDSAVRPGGDGCGPCRPRRRRRPPWAEGQEKRGSGSHSHCRKWAQRLGKGSPSSTHAEPPWNRPMLSSLQCPSSPGRSRGSRSVLSSAGLHPLICVSPVRTSARPPSAPSPHPTLRTDQEHSLKERLLLKFSVTWESCHLSAKQRHLAYNIKNAMKQG